MQPIRALWSLPALCVRICKVFHLLEVCAQKIHTQVRITLMVGYQIRNILTRIRSCVRNVNDRVENDCVSVGVSGQARQATWRRTMQMMIFLRRGICRRTPRVCERHCTVAMDIGKSGRSSAFHKRPSARVIRKSRRRSWPLSSGWAENKEYECHWYLMIFYTRTSGSFSAVSTPISASK